MLASAQSGWPVSLLSLDTYATRLLARPLRWFDGYNRGKPYRLQVKPFNFLLSYQTRFGTPGGKTPPKPVSAYDKDLEKAAASCFDRQTGEAVPQESLRTYEEALAQYHLHPEAKFHNGDYVDSGPMNRRHGASSHF